jgi:hypothetical protein
MLAFFEQMPCRYFTLLCGAYVKRFAFNDLRLKLRPEQPSLVLPKV